MQDLVLYSQAPAQLLAVRWSAGKLGGVPGSEASQPVHVYDACLV